MKMTVLWKLHLKERIYSAQFKYINLSGPMLPRHFYTGTHINKYEHHLGSVGKLYWWKMKFKRNTHSTTAFFEAIELRFTREELP